MNTHYNLIDEQPTVPEELKRLEGGHIAAMQLGGAAVLGASSSTPEVFLSSSQLEAGNEPVEPRPPSEVAISLPNFGNFTHEDWGALAPHHRFALALDHPDVSEQKFTGSLEMLTAVLKKADLMPEGEDELPREELVRLVNAQMKRLKVKWPRSEPGDIISFDSVNVRLTITPEGHERLRDVVHQTLFEVDQTKKEELYPAKA